MPAILAAALTLASALAAPQSPRELLATLQKADNASNLEAVMAVYADDAVLLPPNEAAVAGKSAIRARYTKLFATTRLEVRFEVDDDAAQGTLGFLRGRTIGRRVASDGGVEDLTGKFVMVLKRDGAGWLIRSLIWNGDR